MASDRPVYAWWWQPKLDEQQGGWPFTSVRAVSEGEMVQMEVSIAALPRSLRGWTLVMRAYIDADGKTVKEGLVLVDPDDCA
jgi:hypothetical protein